MKIYSKIILILAFIYGIYLGFLGLSQIKIAVLLGLVLFVIYFIPYFINIKQFRIKYASTLPILQVEKDSERFIQEIKKLINKKDNKNTRNLLNITLAAGYSENGDYNMAYQLLSSVNTKKLLGLNLAVYYINMFAITYNLGNEEKAGMILEDNKVLLQQYENHPKIKDAIAVNMTYRYLAEKDMDKAKFYLDKAEKMCTIPYLNDAIEYLKADIMVNENNYDEARVILKRLKENKVTPSLQLKITNLENVLE